MQRGTGRRHRVRTAAAMLVLALAAAGLAGRARAYVPSLEELYRRIAARPPAIERAIIETRSYVFDPLGVFAPGARAGEEAAQERAHPDAVPPQVPARQFGQRIYWLRDTFLGIETFAADGSALHFYLHEGFRPVQGDLGSSERSFSEADVVPPYLAFVSADPGRWREALGFWGISPQRVELGRGPKGVLHFRLVDDAHRALWIARDSLRPVRLETRIEGGDRPRRLTIAFGEYLYIGDGEDEFFYPRTVSYLLDGRLIKQTRVFTLDDNPSVQRFPITRLRKLARRVHPRPPVPLGRDAP